MPVAGVDVGSVAAKAVILDEQSSTILSHAVLPVTFPASFTASFSIRPLWINFRCCLVIESLLRKSLSVTDPTTLLGR